MQRKGSKKISLAIISLLVFSLFAIQSFQVQFANATTNPITQVQGPISNETTGAPTSLIINFTSVPTSGNTLIVVVGSIKVGAPAVTVSSISQANVNWAKQVNSTSGRVDIEIWRGVVSAGAAQAATIAYSGAALTASAIGYEYSGLMGNASVLDQTAVSTDTNNKPSTGITGATIPNELFIGGIESASGGSMGSPTNGYSLDTSTATYLGYLQKNEPTIGASTSSNVTTASPAIWVGCIATFKASDGPGNYIISGPYYEDNGAVANSNVTVTAYFSNGEQQTFILNGTLGQAQSIALNQTLTPSYISWQAISNFSYTRLYYLTNTSSADIKLFVPNADSTPEIYQFTITDFYGMTNPYIASAIIVDGNLSQQQYILERKPLTVGTVSLIMEQWHSYTLVFECDQGTYTQTFSAENSFLTNINILSGAFPSASAGSVTALATRTNGTAINIQYSDGDTLTQWIQREITHVVNGYTITDYSLNSTDNTVSLLWNNADAETDYTVTFTVNRNGTEYQWIYPCPAPSSGNPFDGIFDFLGTWEINGQIIDPAQLVAAALIMLALAVGSAYSLGFGCVFAWIIGGICIAMGWWQTGLPIFGFAGFTAVLIAIEESKRTTREV